MSAPGDSSWRRESHLSSIIRSVRCRAESTSYQSGYRFLGVMWASPRHAHRYGCNAVNFSTVLAHPGCSCFLNYFFLLPFRCTCFALLPVIPWSYKYSRGLWPLTGFLSSPRLCRSSFRLSVAVRTWLLMPPLYIPGSVSYTPTNAPRRPSSAACKILPRMTCARQYDPATNEVIRPYSVATCHADHVECRKPKTSRL